MGPLDDHSAEMLDFPLNDSTASAFLGGRIVPDDAPPGYQDVAELIRIARTPASADELVDEDYVVAGFAIAVRETNSVSKHTNVIERRPIMFSQLLSAKVAAVATVAIIGGGTAAAVAMPASAHVKASADVSHAGVALPQADTANWLDQAGAAISHAVSQAKLPPTSTDMRQMCVNFAASMQNSASGSGGTSTSSGNSAATSELQGAAASRGETVQQFCANMGVGSKPSTPSTPTVPKATVPSNTSRPSVSPPSNTGSPSGNSPANPWALPTLPSVPTLKAPSAPSVPSGSGGSSVSANVNVNASLTASAH
ncbi:MAG: hypothetical protein ACYCS7_04720 [Acidimicrobiales bacterium]